MTGNSFPHGNSAAASSPNPDFSVEVMTLTLRVRKKPAVRVDEVVRLMSDDGVSLSGSSRSGSNVAGLADEGSYGQARSDTPKFPVRKGACVA